MNLSVNPSLLSCRIVRQVAAGCHKRWEFGIALLGLSACILRRSLPLVTSALQLQAEQAWHGALNMLGRVSQQHGRVGFQQLQHLRELPRGLARQAGMILDAVAISSFGRAGPWRSTLRSGSFDRVFLPSLPALHHRILSSAQHADIETDLIAYNVV